MNVHPVVELEPSFTSDLIDLSAYSIGGVRKLDDHPVLQGAQDRVVQQTGRPTKSIAGCSSVNGID